jgi:hypothetical protein
MRISVASNSELLPANAAGQFFAFGDQARQVVPHHGLEELFLAGVVQVQRALGDASPLSHFVGARGRIALFDEESERRVQQFLRAGLFAALARSTFSQAGGRIHLVND